MRVSRGRAAAVRAANRAGSKMSEMEPAMAKAVEELYEVAARLSEQMDYPFEVSHIKPIREGGKHEIWNLRIMPRIMNRPGRPVT